MVVLPCDTGTSRPLSSIPATSGSSEVHLSFLFVAFSGRIAGANRKAPTPGSAAKSNVLDVASSVRLSMGMLLSTSSIVRRIASLTCMSLASAVSVTSPKASAVTRPLLSTVATLVLELYQAILRLVASAGSIVTESWYVLPGLRCSSRTSMLTFSTWTNVSSSSLQPEWTAATAAIRKA